VVEVESNLTAINSIFGRSSAAIGEFGDELFRIARNTGQSFQEVAKTAQEFARQGLNLEETLKRTNDALILTRLTTLNTEKAIAGLTAVVNGFASSALTTTETINKLRAVETQFAVASNDLIEAVARSASVAQDAGISFEQLLGFITAIKQRTGLGGATIGQGLKTGLTRLNLPTRIAELKALGVAVDGSNSSFDNLVIASKAIDQAQREGNKSLATQIGTVVAGQFQISKLSALFSDLASNQSIATGATEAAINATNQAVIANAAYNKTIEGISKQISNNIGEIFKSLGDAGLQDFFKGIVTDVNVFLSALRGEDIGGGSFFGNLVKDIVLITKELGVLGSLAKGFVNVLTGPALVTGLAAIANTLKNVFTQGGASILQLAGLNKRSEQRIANQRVIQSLLTQANASELKQLELANSQAAKEQIILQILQRQLAVQQALEASSARTAASFAGRFPGDPRALRLGGSAMDGTVTAKGRGFAGGTISDAIQRERGAINRGVGGASPSAKVKVVDSFNYGSGKVGPAVLNTDEILVRGKNGDSVLNRDMVGDAAINSMGGNFARGRFGRFESGKSSRFLKVNRQQAASSFQKLRDILMGNTKFQSVTYRARDGSLKKMTGVQHSTMVRQDLKKGASPGGNYSTFTDRQLQNDMVTLRGKIGDKTVIRNIKLSRIKSVGYKGGVENFAPGTVNLTDAEIKRMQERIRSGQSLTSRQVSRIEAGLASGQGFKIPFAVKDAAMRQASFAAQQAVRGSGRFTPQTPPSGAGQRERLGGRTPIRVRDAQGRFVSPLGGTPQSGSTGFQTFNPPAIVQPSLAETLKNAPAPPTDFSGALDQSLFEDFKKRFQEGLVPSGDSKEARAFQESKNRLQRELIFAELDNVSNKTGQKLNISELRRTKEGKKLLQRIRRQASLNFVQIEQNVAKAVQAELLTTAQTQLQQTSRGFAGLDLGLEKRAEKILQGPEGRRLDPESRAAFKESVAQRKLAAQGRMVNAGFGLSFAGSLAAPLLGQGVTSLAGALGADKERSSRAGNVASGALSGAAMGASIGAFTGTPQGLAIGAAIGGIGGGIAGFLQPVGEATSDFEDKLEKLKERFTVSTTALSQFVNNQQKLIDTLNSGRASGAEVARLFQRLNDSLVSIQRIPDKKIDADLRRRFITATGEERQEILAEVQQQQAEELRRANTLARFEDIEGLLDDRRIKRSGRRGGRGRRGRPGRFETIADVTAAATDDEISEILNSVLADVDLDKFDPNALKKATDPLSRFLAIGIPEEIAKKLATDIDGNFGRVGKIIQGQITAGVTEKLLNERVINAELSKFNFRVEQASFRIQDSLRNLFNLESGRSDIRRIGARSAEDLATSTSRSRLNFRASLGANVAGETFDADIDKITTDFDRGVKDISLGLRSNLLGIFKDKKIGAADTTTVDVGGEKVQVNQRSLLNQILDDSVQEGVTAQGLDTLISAFGDDLDIKRDLIGLRTELLVNQGKLSENTNALLASKTAQENLLIEQRDVKASLNDFKAIVGQDLKTLFGRDQITTSQSERLRVGLQDRRDDFRAFPGVSRRSGFERRLASGEGPEFEAISGVFEKFRGLIDQVLSDDSIASSSQAKQIDAIINDTIRMQEGRAQFSNDPTQLFDASGRIAEILNRISSLGFNNLDATFTDPVSKQEVSIIDFLKQDISDLIGTFQNFSPALAELQTGNLDPGTRLGTKPDPTKVGDDIDAELKLAINDLTLELRDNRVSEEAALAAQKAIKAASDNFLESTNKLDEFRSVAEALNTTLSEGIKNIIEQTVDIDVTIPKEGLTRLDNVEDAVDKVRNQLNEVVDQLSGGGGGLI
jgi:TP901 family phage tail tape measure protein